MITHMNCAFVLRWLHETTSASLAQVGPLHSIAVSLLHYCSNMGFLIQTHAFYGTDVDIVIQTVIQTLAFYGTDVQTVQ